jgi:acyl-CoA reductase-like NAD-dependent aldehyde dehydrogenase
VEAALERARAAQHLPAAERAQVLGEAAAELRAVLGEA